MSLSAVRTAIVDRLKAQVPSIKYVAGVASYAAVARLPGEKTPAAFVFRIRSSARPNSSHAVVDQETTDQYAVLLVTRHAGDAAGGKMSDEIDDLSEAVDAALLNWTPASGYTPIEYASGQLIALLPGFLHWQDIYQTTRHKRVT